MSGRPSMHNYFPGESSDALDTNDLDHGSPSDAFVESAVDEDSVPSKSMSTKNRNRRASEGSHLIKGGGKRVTSEVRCDTCGKGYKHSSCLTKHMWVTCE